ncbi:MAG TPA: L-threonylcarbamoyladenylate synthase [Opitutaceae bacterium]|nr:L-threonylcarbamoyladenylate synthase [Opitutaceae bacterium]
MARIYRGSPRNLAMLAARLRKGGLVAVPTETVYGLAGDATSRAACRRIFSAKGRPSSDPLIVHIASLRDLARVAHANPAALRLAARFWPGPLTIVLPKTGAVPDEATAGLPSVAVRMPSHPLFRRLIRLAGVPLAAPSANPFGYVSPTTASHVRLSLGSRVSHILDGGPSRIGLESTIIDLRAPGRPALLRPGAVTRGQLARALGVPVAVSRRPAQRGRGQVAPGMMRRHYSPRTPLTLHARLTLRMAARGHPADAWLFVSRPRGFSPGPGGNLFWLDARGDLRRAARRLFAMLRSLDEGGFRRIHAERPSGAGLAEALADRLARASAGGVSAPRRPARSGAARSGRRSRRSRGHTRAGRTSSRA